MVKLENDQKVNIGIPMKFESKGLKVLGYTRRNDRGWEYSETAAQALEKYRAAFPEAFNNLGAGGEGTSALSRCRQACADVQDLSGLPSCALLPKIRTRSSRT
jgi:5'-3' exoribonuclease 1